MMGSDEPKQDEAPLQSFAFILVLSFAIPFLRAEEAAEQSGGTEVLERYLTASQSQQEFLKGLSMEADFEANVPNLQKTGKLHALRYISKIGQVTYKVLSQQGDKGVNKDVIARYIHAEMEAVDKRGIGINRDNYRFKYRGQHGSGEWQLHLFELVPKEKRVGLFRGWLWVEARTGVPVREQGEFVKSPSIWLRKITFTRDYEFKGDISVPAKIDTTIETRLVGKAELSIRYTNLQKGEADADTSKLASSNITAE
jgi:hypothetical protein